MLRITDIGSGDARWRARCLGTPDLICGEGAISGGGAEAALAWTSRTALWWGTIRPDPADPQGITGEIHTLDLPDLPERLIGGTGWIGLLLPEAALRIDRRSGEIVAEIERIHPWSDAWLGRDMLVEAGPDGNIARRLRDGRVLPLPERARRSPTPQPWADATPAPDPADLDPADLDPADLPSPADLDPAPPQRIGPGLWLCRGALYLTGEGASIRIDAGLRGFPACLDAAGGLAGPGGRAWSLEDRAAGARLSGIPLWVDGAWWEVTAAGFGPVGGPYLPHGLDRVGDRPAAAAAVAGEIHIRSLDDELQRWRPDGALLGRRRQPYRPPARLRDRELPIPIVGRAGDLRWTADGMLLERIQAILTG